MQRKRMHIKEDFTPVGEVVSISDGNGQPIQITDAKSSKNSKIPDKLKVVVEATHTGINRNKVSYSYDKLELSTDSWTNNYEKPVLLNHNSYSGDPLGRVKSAQFKQSQIDPQKHTIQLTLEITNKAAIERFLDGRYKTFSIGGYTDSAKCSVCGKDIINEGWCGHQRGKKYDGKECYWHLGVMDYDEISVVNSPADIHAQAISVEIVEDEVQDNTSTDPETDSTTTGNKVTDNADGILGQIDGLLGNDGEAENPDGEQQDNKNPKNPDNPDNPEDPKDPEQQNDNSENDNPENNEPDGGDGPQTDSAEVETLKSEKKALEDKVAELESQLNAKDGLISQKDMEIESIGAERDSAKEELANAKTENEGLIQQSVNLAKYIQQSLANSVADLQIAVGDKKLEEKDELVKEYSTFTTKKLNDMKLDLVKPEKITQRATVTSPGQIADGDTTSSTTESGANQLTLLDYENSIVQFLVNKKL